MLRIKELSVKIEEKTILDNVAFQIKKGEFISIIGPNGAGKSTLLKAVLGLIPFHRGEVWLKGQNLRAIERKALSQLITLIPQETHLQFDYSVQDLILMGRFPYVEYWGNYSEQDYKVSHEIMDRLNLNYLSDRSYNSLSGGEKQRVLIARALAQDTDIIMLDETLSFLDLNHQVEIMNLLKDINQQEHKTILIISHNINLSSEYCDRIIILKEGSLVGDGHPEKLITYEMIRKVFQIDAGLLVNPTSHKPILYYTEKRI